MGFLTDLATHIKTWANGRFQTLLPTPAGNNGKVLSSDGTNYILSTISSGGLTNFTETRTVTAPNGTIPVHSIKATGTEANIDFAIVPQGTGAILVQAPTSSTLGGNKRGNYAVDFQRSRTASSSVAFGSYAFIGNGSNNYSSEYAFVGCGISNAASGAHSFVGSGYFNTASGMYSSLGCGCYNIVSGIMSSIGGGYYQKAYLAGQSLQGGYNSTSRVRQDSKLTMQKSTTTAAADEMFIDGSARAVLRNNCAWAFDITILAHSSTNALHTARFKRSGLILRGTTAATTTLEGAVQTIGTDIINSNLSGCAVAISADTTNGSLKIEVRGIAATTIIWQAKIELVEIEI